jgi:hypothetical protein
VAPAVRVHAVCERHRAAGHPTRALHVIDEIRGLLDQYAQWIRDKSVLRGLSMHCATATSSRSSGRTG